VTSKSRWQGISSTGRYLYAMFDTAVNGWLMEATGADIRQLPAIGMVVETSCRFLRQLSFPESVEVGIALERQGRSSVIYRLGIFGVNPMPRRHTSRDQASAGHPRLALLPHGPRRHPVRGAAATHQSHDGGELSMADGINPAAVPSGTGCADCERSRSWWFHLRRCAECGQIGCCDTSPSQHASKHAADTGHPIIRSFEPGEDWFWSYETQDYCDGPALAPPEFHPLDQPTPAPADRVPADWQRHLN